mmetsp:Transcript_46486/g.88768  ORF Transcript_46486/g.88768 Transcript_46486/m.88768 type:complete len:108 (+) Transcript_46486:179-502(+)|eukprot:CAMPEP_0114232238 /NCGR_PEP_ID=MMETSP0058-20121206/4495_1 /TAXON_ID=36894 /ORGANISM="Pyramimonas parkeae, CCMP726" /LENGTH=107 /DNA_ID=CAMNT_0001343689 /DNA_START=148 /DNA_END=471 /DNA_ORIENTATION=-
MGMDRIIMFVGIAFLLHAAYATINYRTHLKLHHLEFDRPPLQVLIEVVIGTLLCLWNGLNVAGDFIEIKSAMMDEISEQLDFRSDFADLYNRKHAFIQQSSSKINKN